VGRLLASDSLLWRMDWLLLGAAFALSALGCLLVYSATRGRTDINEGDPYSFLMRHVLSIVIAIALAVLFMVVGHRRLRGAVPAMYVISLILVAAVLTPLGATINGAHAWLRIGGFSLQPSEFVKLTMVLGMAILLATKVDTGDRKHPDSRTVLLALVLATVPMLVIMLMPDLGSVMVMVVIVLGVLLASGASNWWVGGLITAGIAGALLVWQLGVLNQYQIDRFAAFANPALDPAGAGYNTNQARIAIGSGGLLGKGLFEGSQTSGQFVPEQHTDFVFTVAGEELGFVGAGLVILLIGIVLWRACRIARAAGDLYSTIVAGGVVAWMAFQTFENIGMTLGIMPVAGLPLPFVSYGGSAMFSVWMAVGLLQSIKMQRPVSA
jgi:rod shape determining protein RodA